MTAMAEAPATTQLAREALGGAPGDLGAARAELFERILGRVHAYFQRLIADADAAEECAQETLLVLERSLGEARYDPSRSFNTWIFLKAHQVFVGWCRRRELERRPLPPEVERRLDARTLLRALETELGPDALETFVLRYEGGLTLEQVAEATGCERRTVSRRLEQAHALLERLKARTS